MRTEKFKPAKMPPGFTKLMVDQYIACCYAGAAVRIRGNPGTWDCVSYITGCMVWFCVNKLDAFIPFAWTIPVMTMGRDPFKGTDAEAFVAQSRKKWPKILERVEGKRK